MTDDELRSLVDNYQPSGEVIQDLSGLRLIAMVGPSAVGKTTIMESAVWHSPLLERVNDVTSRARRPGHDDSEFVFMSKEQMIDGMKNKEYAQVALMPTGQLYATRPQDYPRGKIGVMAVLSSAVPAFRKLFPELKVTFIVPGSYETWMGWFNQRQADYEDTEKRLLEAKDSLEFALNDDDTSYILNDEIEKAVARLIQVAEGVKPDHEDHAQQLVADHLEKLKQRQ